jgi:hypothetical protein
MTISSFVNFQGRRVEAATKGLLKQTIIFYYISKARDTIYGEGAQDGKLYEFSGDDLNFKVAPGDKADEKPKVWAKEYKIINTTKWPPRPVRRASVRLFDNALAGLNGAGVGAAGGGGGGGASGGRGALAIISTATRICWVREMLVLDAARNISTSALMTSFLRNSRRCK